MRISDWSSDVCSSDLGWYATGSLLATAEILWIVLILSVLEVSLSFDNAVVNASVLKEMDEVWQRRFLTWGIAFAVFGMRIVFPLAIVRSEEHTSELQSLMRISYAVFCLQKKK